ncbi:MAG TPA: hypothetical protein PKY78_08450 [Candidatus Omnitrophota bacterium]|nr:hypothetical protein [Candidatus Omnitrophota bacterium]HPS21000.1 hypothetical protein [Candidatus Omnitrophota bacterium]
MKTMIIVHDARIPGEYLDSLKSRIGRAEWISLDMTGFSAVYGSVMNHPDIYFFKLGPATFIHAPNVPKNILEKLQSFGIELIEGISVPEGKYPGTARYNAVRVGGDLIHNLDITETVILDRAGREGLRSVNVAQGYCRCAVLGLNGNTAVTSDHGIEKAMAKAGKEIFYLEPSDILLPGEKHGFLGGTSGTLSDGTVIMIGDPASSEKTAPLYDICARKEIDLICAKGLPLVDAGSLIVCEI